MIGTLQAKFAKYLLEQKMCCTYAEKNKHNVMSTTIFP
jgi:hypothetical protein